MWPLTDVARLMRRGGGQTSGKGGMAKSISKSRGKRFGSSRTLECGDWAGARRGGRGGSAAGVTGPGTAREGLVVVVAGAAADIANAAISSLKAFSKVSKFVNNIWFED